MSYGIPSFSGITLLLTHVSPRDTMIIPFQNLAGSPVVFLLALVFPLTAMVRLSSSGIVQRFISMEKEYLLPHLQLEFLLPHLQILLHHRLLIIQILLTTQLLVIKMLLASFLIWAIGIPAPPQLKSLHTHTLLLPLLSVTLGTRIKIIALLHARFLRHLFATMHLIHLLFSSGKVQGKKVILSFGGAGMGGSWAGDNNDCWENCYGKEKQVTERLVQIVDDMGLDGIDLDFEYHVTSEAVTFLNQVTTGLWNALPSGSEITHAPMDSDIIPNQPYYEDVLKVIGHQLDFLMPQYYNGYTRPALDGVGGTGVGSMSALSHYNSIVDNIFGGDPKRMVFGFCIADCSGTNSNANGSQAVTVMKDLYETYPCLVVHLPLLLCLPFHLQMQHQIIHQHNQPPLYARHIQRRNVAQKPIAIGIL